MSACGEVKQGFLANCDDLPEAGTQGVLYLINYAHWLLAAIIRDTNNPNIIKGITLADVLHKAYKYTVIDNGLLFTRALAQGTFKPNWTQGVQMPILAANPTSELALQDMALSRVVAILQDANGFIRVFGGGGVRFKGKGLRLTAAESNSDDADLGPGFNITLSSETQPGPGEYFQVFSTGGTPAYSLPLTLAALEALAAA